MSQTDPSPDRDVEPVTIAGGRDQISEAVLREIYRIQTADDVATTAEVRERIEADPRFGEGEDLAEKIKYRVKDKLYAPGLTNYRNPGTNDRGENQPLEIWLTDRGTSYVEAHSREIMPTRDETAVPIEDRVADLEAELSVLTHGDIDVEASAARADRVGKLEATVEELQEAVEGLREDVDAVEDDADEAYVTTEALAAERAEIESEREKWQESITDQLDDKLETLSGRINQAENSIAMVKNDVGRLRDRVSEVEDTVAKVSAEFKTWKSAMQPIYEWFQRNFE